VDQRRNTAGYLDVLDPALQLGPRFDQRLPVLHRRQSRDLVGVIVQKLLEPEEILAALLRRHAPLGRIRGGRGVDGGGDVGCSARWKLARGSDVAGLTISAGMPDAPRRHSPPISSPRD